MFVRAGGPPPEPPDPHSDEWFPFVEITARLAQLSWVERQIAILFDRWSLIESHAGATILLATAGRHHDWHAELFEGCLATSPQLGEYAAPHPPTQNWTTSIELLTTIDEPGQTVTRLGAIVRELDPWLVRETTALLDLARPVADAHLIRWLRFVEIDHHDDGGGFAELLNALQSNTVRLQDRTLLAELDLTSPGPGPSSLD